MLLRDITCSSRFSCGPSVRKDENRVMKCEMSDMGDDLIEVGSVYPDMSVDRSRRFKMTC